MTPVIYQTPDNKIVSFSLTGRIPAKKNSKQMIVRGGRKFVVPSEAHEKWRQDAIYQLIAAKVPRDAIKRCTIEADFWFADARDKDLSNTMQSVEDVLVEHGVIEDDCARLVWRELLTFMGIDRTRPRCEVTIRVG